jgi:photosystem II stability/assembly factor-like uncharacterized protein
MRWPPAGCGDVPARPVDRLLWPVIGSVLIGARALSAAPELSVDPLDRPAMQVAHPEKAVLVAITTAGRQLVAVGENGIVAIGGVDGTSWEQVLTPVSVTLTAVAFATDRIGWAVGHSGVILVTHDAGQSWQRQLDGRQILALLKEGDAGAPVDAKQAADHAAFLAQMLQDGPDKPLLNLHATDPMHVIVCGAYGLLLVTADGGEHWSPRFESTSDDSGKHLYAVVATATDYVFGGEGGSLYHSASMTDALRAVPSPYPGSYFGLVSASPESIVAYGLRGHAVVTHDGGWHWSNAAISASGSINAGRRLRDGKVVLGTQAGELWVSQDNGSSYHRAAMSSPQPINDLVETPQDLVVVGPRGIAHVALP